MYDTSLLFAKNFQERVTHPLRPSLSYAPENKNKFEFQKCLLVPQGAVPSHVYGLPTIHKTGTPIHPIVSMTGSAYKLMPKWLATLLKTIEETYHTLHERLFHSRRFPVCLHCSQCCLCVVRFKFLFTNVQQLSRLLTSLSTK